MDGSLRRLHHVSEHLFISCISLMFSADDKLVTNYDQLPQVFFLTVLRSSGGGESDEKPFPILRFVDWPSENWVLFYSSDFECRTFFLFICLIFLPVVMHLQCFVVSHVAWNQECDIYHEARSYKCQVLTLPLDNFRIRICIFTDIPQQNKANDLADCETLVFYVKRCVNH